MITGGRAAQDWKPPEERIKMLRKAFKKEEPPSGGECEELPDGPLGSYKKSRILPARVSVRGESRKGSGIRAARSTGRYMGEKAQTKRRNKRNKGWGGHAIKLKGVNLPKRTEIGKA